MKVTIKFKTAVALIAFMAWCISSFAQVNTMYVMKNGKVVFQSPVSGVDNLTFDEAAPGEALVVQKNDGSPAGKTLLNDIQQLSFSDENISLETLSGSEAYLFDDIAKLLFDGVITGINNASVQGGFDLFVAVTPAGDVMVESPVAIKSLALFSADGKMISEEKCNAATVGAVSKVQPLVFLLRRDFSVCPTKIISGTVFSANKQDKNQHVLIFWRKSRFFRFFDVFLALLYIFPMLNVITKMAKSVLTLSNPKCRKRLYCLFAFVYKRVSPCFSPPIFSKQRCND